MSIYIARTNRTGKNHFYLRESYQKDGCYYSRDLLDMGDDPRRYIVYPGGNAYYVHGSVEDRLDAGGVRYDYDELENIFWPYVKPTIQRAVDSFRHRGRRRSKTQLLTSAQQKSLHINTHIFDKRRIHYLKSGSADQRALGRMPAFLLKWLAAKSRDEIEQRFMAMEAVLNPREIKSYVYVIFNLQRHFLSIMAQRAPQALDPAKLDDFFLDEICRLNDNETFWPDQNHLPWLTDYLVRYLIMYFDHEFPHMRSPQDELRDFINRHRAYRPPLARPPDIDLKEASAILGVEEKLLRAMTPRAVTRLYRQLALKAHPDQGGDPRQFIRLTAAYQSVLKRLNAKNSSHQR